jgi:hypothetical protein
MNMMESYNKFEWIAMHFDPPFVQVYHNDLDMCISVKAQTLLSSFKIDLTLLKIYDVQSMTSHVIRTVVLLCSH